MNPTWEIKQGDVLEVLRSMAARSVHMVMTSPPYWGLRDYGLGQWQGGDAECKHERPTSVADEQYQSSHATPGGWRQNKGELPPQGTCGLCGAVQQAAGIGLESTLGEWVQNIVAVGREVWRVLRDDGSFWLNLGDAYAASSGQHGKRGLGNSEKQNSNVASQVGINLDYDLPAKNLMGQPWRVAFALQDDGWILRTDIVWNKLNPMPESTIDRPTRSHEFVFLLAKSGHPTYWTNRDGPGTRSQPAPDYRWTDASTGVEYTDEPPEWSDELIDCPDCAGVGKIEITVGQGTLFDEPPAMVKVCPRCNHSEAKTPGQVRRWKRMNLWQAHDYFYDAEAIKEPASANTHARVSQLTLQSQEGGWKQEAYQANFPGKKNRDRKPATIIKAIADKAGVNPKAKQNASGSHQNASFVAATATQVLLTANKRDVWTIATQPYKEAHFATFPEALVEPPILAGTSAHGVCAECGAPWTRTTQESYSKHRPSGGKTPRSEIGNKYAPETNWGTFGTNLRKHVETLGWQPTCSHDAEVVPATVLDCFAGSGTAGVVALRHGRDFLGIEINPEYVQMAQKRLQPFIQPGGEQ